MIFVAIPTVKIAIKRWVDYQLKLRIILVNLSNQLSYGGYFILVGIYERSGLHHLLAKLRREIFHPPIASATEIFRALLDSDI